MRISDELLSFVYNKKCTFGMIENNILHYYYTDKKGCLQPDFENLDTFIRFSKIKTFNNGYRVISSGRYVDIYEKDNYVFRELIKRFGQSVGGTCVFEICYEIEALEWVQMEIKKGDEDGSAEI